MDQVKEILRQIAKYRFWISVCVATLLSAGAYVLGSGPVQKAAEEETGKITAAYKDVQQYSSSAVPTADFAPVVQAKTAALTKDVDTAWRACYDRQAPLLTWPETVSERFTKWGRKWPEEVADTAVQLAVVDYIEAYPAYVDSVFNVFRPFNYETGEGVVASAPRDQLLQVVAFDINKLPKLNEVWSAQERLWVQHTVLQVVADVNRDAKDWDSAFVKEIKALDVGSSNAQDQRSLSKGDELEEAEPIVAPNEPEEDEEEMGGDMGMMGAYAGMMQKSMGGGMGGPGGMGGLGGAKIETAESVLYLKPEDSDQYKILPVMITVLVDQDRVPDLLVAFENSPMSIEVRDFELQRPADKIVKPEKGDEFSGYGMMGMMGMMGPGGRMGYGGMSSAMMAQSRMMSEMMGPGGMGMGGMGMDPSMMMRGMGGMGGYPGMGSTHQGTDKRSVNRAEKRKESEKALEANKPAVVPETFYNIVEVTIYGQARFYNEPPAPEADEEASPGEADADATEADDAMPAEGDEPKAEAADAEGDETKAEADDAVPAEGDASKAEAADADQPKAETDDAMPADQPQPEAAEPAAPDAAETPKQP